MGEEQVNQVDAVDLAFLQKSIKEKTAAEQQLQQAQQNVLMAVGAQNAAAYLVRTKYAIGADDAFDPATGVITRSAKP